MLSFHRAEHLRKMILDLTGTVSLGSQPVAND